MREPTESEVRKFWEWCGFTIGYMPKHYCGSSGFGLSVNDVCPACSNAKGTIFNGVPYILSPDKGMISSYPPLDLNNLFKYAVPKLKSVPDFVLLQHQTFWHDNGEIHHDWIISFGITKEWIRHSGNDPALALFWAIYKVIDPALLTL